MQGWHTTFLGMRGLPRDISDFEMKAFFTFDGAERDAINARRGDSHKLGLALHIGFLRMSGRLLGAFRVIPVALWRHLGNELGIAAPEVASLRAMYERGRTLFDHQQVACTVLGFQWMSEHQRRSLVRETARRSGALRRPRSATRAGASMAVQEQAGDRARAGNSDTDCGGTCPA
jgi:hypothetical protein